MSKMTCYSMRSSGGWGCMSFLKHSNLGQSKSNYSGSGGKTGNLIWALLNSKCPCHIYPHLQSQLLYHHQCEPGNKRPESLALVYGTKVFYSRRCFTS